MTLLDNELVHKFFACENNSSHSKCTNGLNCMSKRILDAMGQFIQTGDRYLAIMWDSSVEERISVNHWFQDFHPGFLRLPDKFQKKECDCLCHKGQYCCECKNTFPKPTPSPEKCECGDLCGVNKVLQGAVPDAAEEKIKTLCLSLGVNLANSKYAIFVSNMIDLVALVRAEKK